MPADDHLNTRTGATTRSRPMSLTWAFARCPHRVDLLHGTACPS